jgi:hypothetical protein
MARLTKQEKAAVCLVLDEFLAGHDAELTADAFGLGADDDDGDKTARRAKALAEAERILKRLASATVKLAVHTAVEQ